MRPRKRRKHTEGRQTKVILRRLSPDCFWCHDPLTPQTFSRDHVVPRMVMRFTGFIGTVNVVYACKACNAERGYFHDLYFQACKVDPVREPGRCCKMFLQLAKMKDWHRKWSMIEQRAMGWSFSRGLNPSHIPLFVNYTQYHFDGCLT